MQNLYESIVSLLGQPEDCSEFRELVKELKVQVDLDERPPVFAYHFLPLGFCVGAGGMFPEAGNIFEAVTFYFFDSKRGRAYSGSLLNGILSTDSQSEVQAKLGMRPVSRKQVLSNDVVFSEDAYVVSKHRLLFRFTSGGNQLLSLAVRIMDVSF
jgi:hypothetical protein